MDFYDVLDQVLDLLRQRGRVAYRVLKLQFKLDDEALEALKDELIYSQRLAVDAEGKVLVWAGDSSLASPLAAAPAQDRAPLAYTPPHLTDKILAARPALEGERKQVTVLFADLKDSTELIRGLDPEAAQHLLDPAIHIMMDAVHRFEGTVNQVLGDGIMALFGAPIAHEDHALRACYAALAMQAAMQPATEEVHCTRGLGLRMRVGLNSGEVVVRAIGNDLHMDYSAVGETTHLAARMEQLATPGSIRLTAATLGLVEGQVLTLDEALQDTIPALLSLLEVLPDDSPFCTLDPPQRRQRLLAALKRVLLRESQVQPLLLVFEDLHWIDAETQALLDSLVESLPTAQLLLLVNYRPEYQHGWGSKTYYTQLRLDPLPPASADEFLQALLGDDPSLVPLKQLLIARTEGNPFFLEESVRTLVETGVLVGEPGAYRLAQALPTIQVPATVQAVLAARIDRLPPEEKRLLQTAAIIGTEVLLPLLQAIADMPEAVLHRGLAHLQAAEFLYETRLFPEQEYTFKHALTHEVAYGSLLLERRRVLASMAQTRRMTGDPDGAIAAGRQALELAAALGDSALQGQASHFLGLVYHAISDFGRAADALHQLGTLHAHADPHDVAPAEAYYQQALALAEELGMRPLVAHCHLGLGRLHGQTGLGEQARAALTTAIDLYRAMDMTFWLPQTEAALAQVE